MVIILSLYKGYYINLADSTQRRELIEQQIAVCGASHLYERFEAVQGEGTKKVDDPSYFTAREEACLRSHLQILQANLDTDKHIHILEDDAILHKNHHKIVSKLLEQMPEKWDILYTGATFTYFQNRPSPLLNLHSTYSQSSQLNVFNTKAFKMEGAYSYIVNKNSVHKIYTLAKAHKKPIDVILHQFTFHSSAVDALCLFPTICKHNYALNSTLRNKHKLDQELTMLYQSLFFLDVNYEDLYKKAKQFAKKIDFDIFELTDYSFKSLLYYLLFVRFAMY